MPERVTIVSLNLRHDADRWPERALLVREEMVALNPDLIALQENAVRIGQSEWLQAQLRKRTGRLFEEVHTVRQLPPPHDASIESNAMLWACRFQGYEWIKLPSGYEARKPSDERLYHARYRTAQRLRLTVGGAPFDVYNTHLHHEDPDGCIHPAQVRFLLDWIAARSRGAPHAVCGDFNARPGSITVQAIEAAGLRSAHRDVHGVEPHTSPTPLSPEWDAGVRQCIDYVFVSPEVRALDARVVFDRPSPSDPRLYSSDHFGLWVEVEVSR